MHMQEQQSAPAGRAAMQLRRLVASLIVSHVAFIAAATSAEELQCQGLSDSYLTRHHAEPVPYNGMHTLSAANMHSLQCVDACTPLARMCR